MSGHITISILHFETWLYFRRCVSGILADDGKKSSVLSCLQVQTGLRVASMLCWALLRFREGTLLFATAAVDKSLLRQEARHSTSILAEQKVVMWSMQRFEALSKLMRIAEVDELVVELPKSWNRCRFEFDGLRMDDQWMANDASWSDHGCWWWWWWWWILHCLFWSRFDYVWFHFVVLFLLALGS